MAVSFFPLLRPTWQSSLTALFLLNPMPNPLANPVNSAYKVNSKPGPLFTTSGSKQLELLQLASQLVSLLPSFFICSPFSTQHMSGKLNKWLMQGITFLPYNKFRQLTEQVIKSKSNWNMDSELFILSKEDLVATFLTGMFSPSFSLMMSSRSRQYGRECGKAATESTSQTGFWSRIYLWIFICVTLWSRADRVLGKLKTQHEILNIHSCIFPSFFLKILPFSVWQH